MRYGESDTPPYCVGVSSWVEPKPQRTEKLEKETPLTLPISLIADGKWRSSASGFGVLNRHTPRHAFKNCFGSVSAWESSLWRKAVQVGMLREAALTQKVWLVPGWTAGDDE